MTIPNTAGTNRKLIERYGVVTLQEYHTHAETYVAAANRQAQKSIMLYQFLSNSLTEETKLKVLTALEDCMVNDSTPGACFLKTIMSKLHVDTRGTVNTIRESLSNVETRMA
jgi:hypothetical protein